jgi:hypothetical protein
MSRVTSHVLLALLLAPLAVSAADPGPVAKPAPAAPAVAPCSGTISGAVTGKFDCKVGVVGRGDGSIRLTLSPTKLPKSVKALIAGEMDVPAPAKPGVYKLDQLTGAKVVLTSAKHATFIAERPKGTSAAPAPARRGEVTLTLDSVQRGEPGETSPHRPATAVRGSYKAKLVPENGTGSPVEVEVKF